MSPDTIYGIILGVCGYHLVCHVLWPFIDAHLSGPRGEHDEGEPDDPTS